MVSAEPPPRVFVVDDALDAAECAALIARADAIGWEPAPLTVAPGKFERQSETRNNDRAVFDDKDLAAQLFGRLRAHLPERIAFARVHALNEHFRVYRYGAGQRFAPHFDARVSRSKIEQSELTVLFYLNDGCEGGETIIHHGDVRVTPSRGRALVFEHGLLHEGAAVVSGQKFVLRTDVMYRGNRRVYITS